MDTAVKQSTRMGGSNYSVDFTLSLAVAAEAPNVSMSKLALEHEVNENTVFKLRRHYGAALFGVEAGRDDIPAGRREDGTGR